MDAILLKSYFRALDFDSAPTDLEGITRLQRAHLATFSFSSIGVILGESLPLDIESLVERIVVRKRGGYCFDHNKLFFEVLNQSGFDVRIALARVVHDRDIDVPLTHRLTILNWQGVDYLADVGFGPLTPRAPLDLSIADDIDQNGFVYRITHSNDTGYSLQTIINGAYFTLYTFELNHCTEADCELGHFYSYKHPEAVFVNNLVVSNILAKSVHSLRNTGYRKFNSNTFSDTAISNASDLNNILSNDFGVELSKIDCNLLYQAALKTAVLNK